MAKGELADCGELIALGLSEDAVALYAHVLVTPNWKVDEISAAVNLAQERIDAAIAELMNNNLTTMSAEQEGMLHLVAPNVGLTRLLAHHETRLRREQSVLASARTTANAMIARAAEADAARRANLELVTDADEINERISAVLLSARSEVVTMLTTMPGTDALERARIGDLEVLGRGIDVKLLVLAGHTRRSPALVAHIRELESHGAQVKVAASLPTRMIIVDRTTAIVPVDPDCPQAGATVVNQRGFLGVVLQAFDSAWREARPLDEHQQRRDSWQPSPLQAEVIRLLAAGNKDEAIGRRVGMSLRSVRRVVSQISDEIESDSRFAMGVRCAERGLT